MSSKPPDDANVPAWGTPPSSPPVSSYPPPSPSALFSSWPGGPPPAAPVQDQWPAPPPPVDQQWPAPPPPVDRQWPPPAAPVQDQWSGSTEPAGQPVNPLQWQPFGTFSKAFGALACQFILCGPPQNVHSFVLDQFARNRLKLYMTSSRYRPSRAHVMIGRRGSTLLNLLDPSDGLAATVVDIEAVWSPRPNDLISFRLEMKCDGRPWQKTLPPEEFVGIALGFLEAFRSANMLVWVGEIGGPIGSERAAPASPRQELPFETTPKGIRQARKAGWRARPI